MLLSAYVVKSGGDLSVLNFCWHCKRLSGQVNLVTNLSTQKKIRLIKLTLGCEVTKLYKTYYEVLSSRIFTCEPASPSVNLRLPSYWNSGAIKAIAIKFNFFNPEGKLTA